MIKIFRKSVLSAAIPALFLLLLTSCEKEAGEGGNSTIYGKVYLKDYNDTFTVLEDEYYAPDVWVYIVYGDDRDYSDRIRTGYDGTYEFKYLREGTYTIYTYSKDSTLQTTAPLPILEQVEITKRKQTIQVPDLVIFD